MNSLGKSRVIETRLAGSADSRDFFRYARSRIGGKPGVSVIKTSDGQVHTSPTDQVDLFAEYFSSMFLPDAGDPVPPCAGPIGSPALSDIVVEKVTVYEALRALGSKFTVTPDGLPPFFFSRAALGLARPLQIIFNMSLGTGVVPKTWKEAYVTPIFKGKGSRFDVGNYRPISITVVPSKVLERILVDGILKHSEYYSLLDNSVFVLNVPLKSSSLLRSMNG